MIDEQRSSATLRPVRCTSLLILCALCASGVAFAESQMKESAAMQIRAIYAEKANRSPARRKIDSQLLVAMAQTQRATWLSSLPQLRRLSLSQRSGRHVLDIDATIDAALIRRIEALGGRIENAHSGYGAARIELPLAQVDALAEDAAVRGIRPAAPMMTQMVISEGDVAHTADVSRGNFGVDGSGVMACAMSDSIDALATLQGTGELPGTVFVVPGQDGVPGTSEGTALLEIIHDLAPGADLGFATGAGGQAQMAQNILDLAAAGCDVIVDDVLYLTEAVFQDGIIAQAVDQVFADGVSYFTSAGNSGNLTNDESGVFEGDYVPTALPAPLVGAGLSAHDFGGGNAGNELTADPPVIATLQWNDPFGGASNDYDLFLLDAALANVIAFSTNVQDGDDLPVEFIDSSAGDDTGNRLVVLKFGGDDRFLHLNTHRGRLDVGTDGQIFGHPAALGAMTVAAVNVATAGGGAFTGGAANPVEFFSSDGPRRIFFEPDGTPVRVQSTVVGGGLGISPGGPPPQITRQKPDVAAADGVSTTTPGFDPFFGTSASAPHCAAISALFQELFPSIPVDQMNDIFRSTALDIEDPGFDDVSGSGIMMSNDALNTPIFADGFESGDTSAWTN